ncbi:dihydropteroate synthase [Lactococcus nasutitermitis]|uniref:Dihydropteroate synthase n=1 Tax=Lactococcus nasutitermitis TaxID=1652957 RepID=A0ABV9JGU6_9LACT|nr:dihydropteroate synthase [Lactococcus nasutitermitis]
MKIIELNLKSFGLKVITIKFSEITSQTNKELQKRLYHIGNQIQISSDEILLSLTIYELYKLIKSWKNEDEKEKLSTIFERHRIIWAGKNFSFDLTLNPIVYSIMNVTPDSFYDGAKKNLSLSHIMKVAEENLSNGADVLELGGKSSRPGYSDITPEEEWLRLKVAIAEMRKEFPKSVLAVDTDEAYVMERAIDAGIDIINDIDGFDTEEKLKIVHNYLPSVVAMNNGRAGFSYADNVYEELPKFFMNKGNELLELGLKKEQICIDAGVGFWNGPSGSDSVQRVKSTDLLAELGFPVMIAISRKSFMENIFSAKGDERLFSSLMLEAQMIADGGRILRVHDTKETKHLIDAYKLYQEF